MNYNQLVSIVIPVRNEKKYIGRCLDCIINQSYPIKNIELIIVDGCSVDGTINEINHYSKKLPRLIILENDKKTVPGSMNIGIKQSKGDYIIRVDARSFIDKDYIKNCLKLLKKTKAWNVGGRQKGVEDGGLISKCISACLNSPFGMGGAKFHYSNKEQFVDTVYLGAFPKFIFDTVGLYDESLKRNQDYELNYRILESGGKVFFSPTIKSEYIGRKNYKNLFSQFYQYGFWKYIVLKKHPKSLRLRQIIAPIFVIILLILFINLIKGNMLLLYFILIHVVASLIFASSIYLNKKCRLIDVIIMPSIFFIMHLSWGAGFINSLIINSFKRRFFK